MNQHVLLEMRRLCGGVGALFATERFSPRMAQQVGLEMSILIEGASALFAAERFFSGMNHHVALEGRGCCGRVITTCANNRFLTIMNQICFFFLQIPIISLV